MLLTQRRGEPGGSAELEARGALDGIEQLAAQQRLVWELGELQQVHARAGRGEPLQVRAAMMDAEGGVQLLQERAREHSGSVTPKPCPLHKHTHTDARRANAPVVRTGDVTAILVGIPYTQPQFRFSIVKTLMLLQGNYSNSIGNNYPLTTEVGAREPKWSHVSV